MIAVSRPKGAPRDHACMRRGSFVAAVLALLGARLGLVVASSLATPASWRALEAVTTRAHFNTAIASLDLILVVGIAVCAWLRSGAGPKRWLAATAVLTLLLGLPLLGPTIESLFVPEPGIDHGAWQQDIPDYVTATGLLVCLALLATLARRRPDALGEPPLQAPRDHTGARPAS